MAGVSSFLFSSAYAVGCCLCLALCGGSVCAGSLDATDGKPTTSQATTDEARNSRGQIPTIVREGLADRADARKDAEAAASADFATYFYSYAELDHQKQMLEDNRYVANISR